jgi:arylsulfatase A-like enzyme/tetratricopeptide (TPR) repeat protein
MTTLNATTRKLRFSTIAPRSFLVLISLLTLPAMFGGCRNAAERVPPARPRVIVLVTIDTLRADRLGSYGSPRKLTPALDRLAAESVRFEAAVAQVPLTLPSHATILTGLRPPSHGVRTNDGFRLPADVPTLAESLLRAGYRTAAFIGALPLRRSTGIARGFEQYDDGFLATRNERPANEVVAAAAAWIGEHRQEQLFVWLHLFDPHTPYEAPPEHATRHPTSPYDAEVEYTDRATGRFFDTLRELGAYDDAFIIVVSDHGESLGEHGERTHGTFLYDATIRIPLLIRMPGVSPRVVTAPVETTDLAPTIASIARSELPRHDGIDLTSLLAGASGDEERAAYAESSYQHVLLGWSPLRAIRTARWKFVEAPRSELYDLVQDPGETTNLASHRASLAAGLSSALPRPVPAGSRASGRAAEAGREETDERLRSLGYFSGRTLDASAGSRRDPKDHIDLWSNLEEGIELASSDPAGARRALQRALALDPRNGLALKYLGDISYREGRYRDAADRYRAALVSGFVHPDVLLNLAAAMTRLGNPNAALAALQRGVELDPDVADAWNQLGILHASAGRSSEARDAFERAVSIEPSAAEPRYNLALLARGSGHDDTAIRLLGEALARRPNYPEALFERGNSRLARGEADAALEDYRSALTLRPDYAEALFGAARAATTLGLSADARRYYEQFLHVAPRGYREHRTIARRELARLGAQEP